MTALGEEFEDRFSGIDIESLLNRGARQPLPHGRMKALYEAPEFIQRLSSEETVMEGQSLCIDCMIRGFPVPTIRWFKDDEEIVEHPRIHIESNGIGGYFLIIDNVVKDDEAAYRCRAENVEGACSSFFFLSVKSKPKNPRKRDPRVSGWRTVSYPPMFSTILERVEEEEEQGREFESLPASPLTQFYYALTLKGRQNWTTFVGDWAFASAGISDNDDEDDNIFDNDDDDDDIYADLSTAAPIYMQNGFICDKLNFSASNQARLAAKRNLRRSELVKAKKKRLNSKKAENREKQDEKKRINKNKENLSAKDSLKSENESKAGDERDKAEDMNSRTEELCVKETMDTEENKETERETERTESKLMCHDRLKEAENMKDEKQKLEETDEQKKGNSGGRNRPGEMSVDDSDNTRQTSYTSRKIVVRNLNLEEENNGEEELEPEKQDFEQSEKENHYRSFLSRYKKEEIENLPRKEEGGLQEYTSQKDDSKKDELRQDETEAQKLSKSSVYQKEEKTEKAHETGVECIYQRVKVQDDNKLNAYKYLDSTFSITARKAPSPDAVYIWKSAETSEAGPETMFYKQRDNSFIGKEKSPLRCVETNTENKIRWGNDTEHGASFEFSSSQKVTYRNESTSRSLPEAEARSPNLRARQQRNSLNKKQQTDQERLEELRQKEIQRMEELRQEEQKRMEELKLKENSAMYTLHKKERFQPLDLWARQQLQIEELRRKEQLQREELRQKEQRQRQELHKREEKQKEELKLLDGRREEYMTQEEKYQQEESISKQREELKLQEHIQKKDLQLKEMQHKKELNMQEELQKEELIEHEQNQMEEMKLKQRMNPREVERMQEEERARKAQKEEEDYLRRERKKEQLRKEQLRRQYQEEVRRHKKKQEEAKRQREREAPRSHVFDEVEKYQMQKPALSCSTSRDRSDLQVTRDIKGSDQHKVLEKDLPKHGHWTNGFIKSDAQRVSSPESRPVGAARINIIRATDQGSSASGSALYPGGLATNSVDRPRKPAAEHNQKRESEDFRAGTSSLSGWCQQLLDTIDCRKPQTDTEIVQTDATFYSQRLDSRLSASPDSRISKSPTPSRLSPSTYSRLSKSPSPSRLSPSNYHDSFSPMDHSQKSKVASLSHTELSNLASDIAMKRADFRHYLTFDSRIEKAASYSTLPRRTSLYKQDSLGSLRVPTHRRASSWLDDLSSSRDTRSLDGHLVPEVGQPRDAWRDASSSSFFVGDRSSTWYRPRLIFD